jgi:two-component system chemotaxis sensor kinase CheA
LDHHIIAIAGDDDGLAIDEIKEKAMRNGLTTEAELAPMFNQRIMQFIFKPGFSTAAKEAPVYGCGVGMDVVKTNKVSRTV